MILSGDFHSLGRSDKESCRRRCRLRIQVCRRRTGDQMLVPGVLARGGLSGQNSGLIKVQTSAERVDGSWRGEGVGDE
jgi:hypothetical protein